MTSAASTGEGRPAWLLELRSAAAGGWIPAIRRGLIAFALVWVLGQAVAVLLVLARPGALSVAGVVQLGGVFFYAFHHAAIRVEVTGAIGPAAPFAGPVLPSLTVGLSILLATAVAAGLLFLAGRAVASSRGGPLWARALHGAKPAVPYAALAFLLSFATRVAPQATSSAAGPVPVMSPVPTSALLWTLGLGVAFGAAGGAGTGLQALSVRPWRRRLAASLLGGWRMTWVLVGLAMLGLLVLAAVDRDATRAYFDFVSDRSAGEAVLVVLLTALLLPNMAVAVATVAMGGAVSVAVLGITCPLLSFGAFPRGSGASAGLGSSLATDACATIVPVEFGPTPPAYFLFLLVPAVATLAGGWRAAQAGAATKAKDGVLLGAAAGVVFSVFLLGITLLSGFSSAATGPVAALAAGGAASVGPRVGTAVPLALGWGMVGGAGGALLWIRWPRQPRPEGDVPREDVMIDGLREG